MEKFLSKSEIVNVMLNAIDNDYWGNFSRVEVKPRSLYLVYVEGEQAIYDNYGLIKEWERLRDEVQEEIYELYLKKGGKQ